MASRLCEHRFGVMLIKSVPYYLSEQKRVHSCFCKERCKHFWVYCGANIFKKFQVGISLFKWKHHIWRDFSVQNRFDLTGLKVNHTKNFNLPLHWLSSTKMKSTTKRDSLRFSTEPYQSYLLALLGIWTLVVQIISKKWWSLTTVERVSTLWPRMSYTDTKILIQYLPLKALKLEINPHLLADIPLTWT